MEKEIGWDKKLYTMAMTGSRNDTILEGPWESLTSQLKKNLRNEHGRISNRSCVIMAQTDTSMSSRSQPLSV